MYTVHQFSSVAHSFQTLFDPMDCSTPGLSITNSRSLPKLMSIESVMPSNYLILCRPFFSGLQSFPASGSFLMSHFFTSGGQSIGVSFSISPSSEYSGLSSFRIDWFDLFAVQGSYGTSVINFLRTFHAVFHSGCTSLQWTNIPSSTHPPQHLSLVFC